MKKELAPVISLIDPDNLLAAEILKEAGEAYFSVSAMMVASLEALATFDRATAALSHDGEQVTRRSELMDDVAKRVHFVLIQRDAMQLSGSATFLEDYEVPAEVIARLGQRKQ
jgi:hypothetical protein